MHIGLYFGSFNPVHVGHLIIASYARHTTDLKQAKQLLDAAGVAPGTELTFLAPTGRGDNAGVILQQQIEHFRVGLFNLIEEYHRIRILPNATRELRLPP